MKIRLVLVILLGTFFSSELFAEEKKSVRFLNYNLELDHIDTFFEDSYHRIWVGTFQNGIGLFDINGFVPRAEKISHYGIHCFFQLDDLKLLIGTRKGLFLFDMKTHNLSAINAIGEEEVMAIYSDQANNPIVFCAGQIITLKKEDLVKLKSNSFNGGRLVQAIKHPDKNGHYIVLSDGIYDYDSYNGSLSKYRNISLNSDKEILLCLAYQNDRLWIGSDHGLYSYNFHEEILSSITTLSGYTVRTLLCDPSSGLWVGTNDGLFNIYMDDIIHYRHRPDDNNSLLNNCVWSLFQDTTGNIWIGLDYAVAIIPHYNNIRIIRWNEIIKTDEGNRITKCRIDSKGRYWIGGINGLGIYDPKVGLSMYFKNHTERALPNNTIRDIFEDMDGNIWIGTDGGIARYDEKSNSFDTIEVTGNSGNHSSIWTYGIFQTPDSIIWLATCSGGILGFRPSDIHDGKVKSIVNLKKELIVNNLRADACVGLAADGEGNIYVNAENALYRIEKDTRKLQVIPVNHSRNLKSSAGALYFHNSNKLYSIIGNKIDSIDLKHMVDSHGLIVDIAPSPSGVWFLTSDMLGKYDFKTRKAKQVVGFEKGSYQSCHYMPSDSTVWLGGVDNLMSIKDDNGKISQNRPIPQSLIMDIIIDGNSITPDNSSYLNADLAYSDHISLPSDLNNITFRIGNSVYDKKGWLTNDIVWRVSKLDKEWKPLQNASELSFYNLKNGDYILEFAFREQDEESLYPIRSIGFTVKTPWFLSAWFKFIVLGVVLSSLILLYLHLRTKQKLIKSENIRKQVVEVSKMKMDFLANISHDLKNPISMIMAPVAKMLKSTRTPSMKSNLELIDQNVRKLNEMVMRMIDYTISTDIKVTEDGLKIPVEINSFIESTIEKVKEAFKSKDIEIIFKPCDKCIDVMIDPTVFEIVMNNLYSNALKFTNEGGYLEIRITEDDKNVGIAVCDSGIGIAPDELPMIFSRFYKGKSNRQYNPDGTGIGLDIVKHNVEASGGNVKVTSELDKGTCFTISLPRQVGEFVLNNGEQSHMGLECKKLLIVDDNPYVGRYLCDELHELECRYAPNGEIGLQVAEEWKPDIIISDINMPQKTGIELIHILRKNLLTRHIPIIILSGKHQTATRIEALKAGANAFISKPFEMEELSLTVNRLLQQNIIKPVEFPIGRDAPAAPQKSEDEKFFDLLTKTIEENLDDSNLGVNELADKMNMSGKNLYRRVKTITGYAPVEFIRSVRLQKAALLLREPHLTVNEVMYMVGFSTPSYFSKCFTEKYGKSPSSYRQL